MQKKQIAKPKKNNSLKEDSANPQPQAGKKAHREGIGRTSQGNIKYPDEKKGRPKTEKNKI